MRVRVGVGLALLLLIILGACRSMTPSTAEPLPTRTRAAELATLTAIAPRPNIPSATPVPTRPGTPTPTRPSTPVAAAPQGIVIFQSSRDTPGTLQLYAMRADGGPVRRLGGTTPGAGFPRLSPDGTRVAFVGNAGKTDDIYVVNLDGTGIERVTTGVGNNRFPAWSPDGRRLAFGSDRTGDWEIYTVGVDGSGLARVTSNAADDNLPAWSPDGQWIAFQSDRDGAMHLYKARPDGADPKALTRGGANDRYPAWSPDGRRIAFYSDRTGGTDQLYAIDADGTRATQLLTSGGRDQLPTWSPDGRWIAFASEREGRWGIYQLGLDQGVERLLIQLPDSYAPTWGAATPAAASLLAGTTPATPTFAPRTATAAAAPGTPTTPVAAATAPRATAPPATPTATPPPPTPVPSHPATSSATAAGIGQTVRIRNWELTVRGVGRLGQNLKWSDAGDTSTANGSWLVVTVDMENTGNRNFGVGTWDFSILAAGDITYDLSEDIGAYIYSSYQGGGSIGELVPPGTSVRYYLVFDIAPDATGLRLVFEQDTRPIIDLGQ